eukprot:280697-Pleurochrysis_carterae.AAC.2
MQSAGVALTEEDSSLAQAAERSELSGAGKAAYPLCAASRLRVDRCCRAAAPSRSAAPRRRERQDASRSGAKSAVNQFN